ncbi:nuclear transport factor 2 family protein [Streptomyces sp. NPDC006285]|uniref:nuclear transport factor 2 family protein n=1 Tax=Streptomyces sp. NPDC006285 TaxID=3364742 RepID=UPI0036D14C0C
MSWTRVLLTAVAVCALLGALLVGATGCGSGGAREDEEGEGVRPSPAGEVLKNTDEEGRHYREIGKRGAPGVEIEIQPDGDDGWDVRLTVHAFRFSPAGTAKKAEPGRGYALLRLDDRPLSVLRGPVHHLAGNVVPRGTHQVTVRLHADDDTVWAVDGEPVQSTADITVSDPGPARPGRTTATGVPLRAPAAGVLPPAVSVRGGGRQVTRGTGPGGREVRATSSYARATFT